MQTEARKERRKTYRAKHKKDIAAKAAAYREAHKLERATYNATYDAAHKARVAARHAARYAAHKDEMAAYCVAYRNAHPEKHRAAGNRRRARKRGAEGAYTDGDIKEQYTRQKGKCFWCGVKVRKDYHVDHVVPLSRGGSNWPENLVIACAKCNTQKGSKLPHEWAQGGRLL